MKKILALALSLMMILTLVSCTAEVKPESSDVYKVALVIPGNLGDKSFYDSANEGLEDLKKNLGEDKFDFKVEQMGGTPADEAKWEPTMLDYCDSKEYDLIITGNWMMLEPTKKAAMEYPEQKFVFFDETFDFAGTNNAKNVYNVMYKQNEVSYLVGAAAAMMTSNSSIKGIDASNKYIGFLGGMEDAVINDFLVGYIQGAKDIDADVKVAIAFVGDYVDSTKAKDLALAQYQNGVDVGFNVAGNAGLGQIEAAADTGKYAFGVDSDQGALLPQYIENIPSSAVKNIGASLYRAIKLNLAGELKFGETEVLGFLADGVGIVKDDNFKNMLPEEIQTKLKQIENDIIDGKIEVVSAFNMTPKEIQAIKDSVKPE